MATRRYASLIPLVIKAKPKVIVEVGVHNAMRAVVMADTALKLDIYSKVHYIGYDVFETKDMQFQEEALNGKGMANQTVARARLFTVQQRTKTPEGIRFTFEFVIGDTRETLHGKDVKADFVFIDGDHRVDAIAGDYRALQSCPIIVFDDYFMPDANGKIVDLTKYGCNYTVNFLKDTHDVEILPSTDRCAQGGISHLAVVRTK